MHKTIATVILLIASASVHAQWQVVANNKPPPAHVAQAVNPDGARLLIFRDTAGEVHLRFRLHPGFDQLTGCPTFQVSGKPPVHQSNDGGPCVFGDNWADYGLGRIHDSQMNSLTLHRIMNGDEITLRYPLKNHRYGESRFSLDRSKEAVMEVIGRRVGVGIDKPR